jgi:hypothetical protein
MDKPLPPSSKIITYDPGTNAFYLNGAKLSSAQVSVEVSSVIPVAGFLLAVDNSKGVGDGTVALTTDRNRLGVYEVSGSTVSWPRTVKKGAVEYFLVTYPDMNPANLESSSWGDAAGYGQNGEGRLKFTAKPATLTIQPSFASAKTEIPLTVVPKVVNTDNYAFGGGVFENSRKVFVPFDPADISKYDPYYYGPAAGESYSGFLFNNVMLSSDYGMGLGTTYGKADKLVPTGFGGTDNLGAVSASELDRTYYLWPVHYNTASSTTYKSGYLELKRPEFALFADKPSDPTYAVTYSAMASKLTAAMREANNLLYSYSQIGKMSSYPAALSAMRVALKDVFLAVEEGAVMHVVWLRYNANDMGFQPPLDITPSFEYPGDLTAEATIGLLASPYQKYLLAYAGQKRNMGYYCAYPGGICNTPETSIYVKGEKPGISGGASSGFYRDGTAEEKAALPELSSSLKVISGGSGSGSAAYSNPVSGKTEENPQLKCAVSKMSRNGECLVAGSNDACVITASSEWIYVKADGSRAFSVGQCGGGTGENTACKDCFGHPCDAQHVEPSNFNGESSGKGFDPYALKYPAERCFTYTYSLYELKCISPHSCQMCPVRRSRALPSAVLPCGVLTTWPPKSVSPEYVRCGDSGIGCDSNSHNAFPSIQGGVETASCLRTDVRCDRCTVLGSCGDDPPQCPSFCPSVPQPDAVFPTICVPQTICSISGFG